MRSQAISEPAPPCASLEMLCRRLPPFPPLANQLLELFSSPDACIQTAEMLIRSDGVFSGELLRLANSAAFSAREPFEDVTPAVMYLGFERVQSVIRRVTYARLMRDQFQHPFTIEIHQANLASAFVCEQLLKACVEGDDLEGFCPYSLGLYLKIGASALLRAYPKEYPRLLCSRLESPEEVLRLEAERFGHHHVAASEFLVKQWGFPPAVQELVAGHQLPVQLEGPITATAISRLSWRIAGALGFSFLKGLTLPKYEELMEILPAESRISLPSKPEDWKDAISKHLESLKLIR